MYKVYVIFIKHKVKSKFLCAFKAPNKNQVKPNKNKKLRRAYDFAKIFNCRG
ncbi:hypothetical protein HFN_2305 [Helicobacter fennelliae MRY12-0050]|uniref:Uncharacterized protein n=1 Tax=Helicobacter fennelliae MRY12-0050 TaxID=1325130 RepID=T1DVA4_9HELI|nr:hypothetical protein HFN_2305 [Helicobacter fennelliae MRY12-0050]